MDSKLYHPALPYQQRSATIVRVRYLPPENELEENFVRAGGPGGQHVNRTETAVQLRWDAGASKFIDDSTRQRLLGLAGNRADSGGVITIVARDTRSQRRNREEARRRLAELIEQASRRPERRVRTRPTRAAKKKRLEGKRHRSRIKRKRGKPGLEE